MDFLTKKTSEVPFWQILLGVAVVGFAVKIVYDMLVTENVVVTANNGSFVKRSFMGPISTEARTAAIASYNDAVTAKDSK